MSKRIPRPRHAVTFRAELNWHVDSGLWVTCFMCRRVPGMVGVEGRGWLCSPCARAAVAALDKYGREKRAGGEVR